MQVYAALWDEAGTYLIARKRCFNNWWGDHSAPVLAAEVVALLCKITANAAGASPPFAEADWDSARNCLRGAWLAANGLREKDPAYIGAAQALGLAYQNACTDSPSCDVVTDKAMEGAGHLLRVKFGPSSSRARVGESLESKIKGAGSDPLQWNAACVDADTLARDMREWARQKPLAIVNQAGQWSLPGGRINPGESAEQAARREFSEETGFALENPADFSRDLDIELKDPGGNAFQLVRFKSTAALDGIVDVINRAIRSRVGANRPNASAVCDWEIASVQRIDRSQLTHYLGVHQPLAPQTIEEGAYVSAKLAYPPKPGPPYPTTRDDTWPRRESQAIGWYAQMATHLQTSP
ncbi:NUDIX domain-containing protein [Xanthomonas dyei]|nr:NUDIX hydrolase [Xanthomonas dyei]